MNRENIYSAVFAKLEKLYDFKTTGRKVIHWDDVSEQPALFMTQKNEDVKKTSRDAPPITTLHVEIYLYAKVEDGDTPSIIMNDILDTITDALSADDLDNRTTLGGLVEDVWIDGTIETDEGSLGNQTVAIVPVSILVSQ